VLLGELLGHEEGVLVRRLGRLEHLEPLASASVRSASTVSSTSPVASGSASGPFSARLRYSVKVAAYSGTTSMLPLSSSGAYSSRFSTGLTSTV
jgi:hypothetical protein